MSLNNVGVRFRKHAHRSGALKEAVLRRLRPPQWTKGAAVDSNSFWGLRGVNIQLKDGDRLGIIGRNGAGKSTLLKVISRIYRPTEGAVGVQGRIVPLIEIGAGFNPELSGRENAFLNGAILGIPRKIIAEKLESIIDFSELKDFIDMPVKYYSTGMHLKLAFTLATESPPDILILDELYAGGDASFIEKANRRLEKFVSESRILIIVAHNLEYIRRFANRAMILSHGTVVEEGTPQSMIDRYLADSKAGKLV